MSSENHEEAIELIIQQNHDNRPTNSQAELENDFLLRAVLENNENELEQALNLANPTSFTVKHQTTEGPRNVINIACTNNKVSENVFRRLLNFVVKHYGIHHLSEPSWYYWEPIHFAAASVSLGKLKIILNLVGEEKVNVLSAFSENALHVLLKYGKRSEFNVHLTNGWESKVCHVISQEQQELVLCATELVKAGIDINHNNLWNETPLIIAIRYRLVGVIKLLLRRKDLDLDTYKDPVLRKSARDLLRENEICLDIIPSTATPLITPVKSLFTLLKNSDEDQFLRYNNENIRLYAKGVDGDWGNMLQLCMVKGYIQFQMKTPFAQDEAKDIMKTHMLKVFYQSGFVRSIIHLLNNELDVKYRSKLFHGATVFQAAVKLNYYPFVAIVLEHMEQKSNNQVSVDEILEALETKLTSPFNADDYNLAHLLSVLLGKLEIKFNVTRAMNYRHNYAMDRILDQHLNGTISGGEFDENVCQVLRLGAGLIRGHKDASRLENISPKTLENHLDECIYDQENVCYNSIILDNEIEYSESEVVHFLAHDEKCELLNHPALIYFIHLKWLTTRNFFYVTIGHYILFLVSLYVYMIMLQTGNVSPAVFSLFLSLLTINTLKEFLQLILYRMHYFYDITNYIEAVVIVSCYINVFTKEETTMVIAILLSTLIFLLMLGQLPTFTKYMIIFSSTKYFFKYAMFYFIQFFSFALSFFIVLPPDDEAQTSPVSEIFVKLFDSLVFFIGQYDGPVTHPPNFPILGRVIVAIFIFCMTIILNNLLVGLIVTDMDIIQKTSKSLRQIKIVKYIVRIERFVGRMRTMFCCFPFHNTNIFEPGSAKIKNIYKIKNVFDDDDKAWLKSIRENHRKKKNVSKELYDHIIDQVYNENKAVKGNKDILFKLTKLEEQIRRRYF